ILMYESYFGLRQRPFAETVDPSAYIALPSRAAALRRLHFNLMHSNGSSILFGPSGSGKSMIARVLAAEPRTGAVPVTFPLLSPIDPVTHLSREFGGQEPPSLSMSSMLKQLRERLAAVSESGARSLLIIDDAHLIHETATFDALRLLLNFT